MVWRASTPWSSTIETFIVSATLKTNGAAQALLTECTYLLWLGAMAMSATARTQETSRVRWLLYFCTGSPAFAHPEIPDLTLTAFA